MCGICGIYNFNEQQLISREILKRMTDVLAHRGPDDEGYYVGGNIGLGHRRLSIIDLAAGHQPMSNEDGSIWIVFNGEIYNYPELHKTLLNKGHKFKTKSDTETIIHLYEEEGEDCVNNLRGMFAFAIWDQKNRKLLLARDRLGIKPLYYFIDNERCIFGSEMKSILQCPDVPREVNPQALDDYLTFLCVPAPKTIFRDVKKLLPGCILICTPDRISVKQYWDVDFSDVSDLTENDYIEQIYHILQDSVKCRLMSEVPLGAFLSGGIDSSAIVGIMSNLLENPVTTSSIGFREKTYSELNYAKIVASHFKTEHHEHIVTPDASEILPKLIWHLDEPFADASAIPTYYVSQTARQHVTVALSGDGGDEMFAGYRRYYYDSLENYCRQVIPTELRRYIIGTIAKIYPKADWLPQPLRAKTFLTNVSMSPERGFFNSRSTCEYQLRQKLYTPDFKRKLDNYDSFNVLEHHFQKANTDDALSKVQYVDIKTYLVDDILTKVDRMSMAHSLEVRVPLLDHNLVEYVATIPSNLKLKGKQSKYIFKNILRNLLPEEILLRKKMGFTVPIGNWLKNDLKPMAEELLLNGRMSNRGYFEAGMIKKMWEQHQRGIKNYESPLWCLLILEMWNRIFIDQESLGK